MITRLMRDQKGATAIEYALVTLLIGMAVVTAIGSVGSSVSGAFARVATSF